MADRPSRIDSQAVYSPDGQRVQVLFYDDGSIRFRIYGAPWAIEEAFLTGSGDKNAIIKVVPR